MSLPRLTGVLELIRNIPALEIFNNIYCIDLLIFEINKYTYHLFVLLQI